MKKLMLILMMAAITTFAFGSLAMAQDAPTTPTEPPAPIEGPDGEPMPMPIPEGLR